MIIIWPIFDYNAAFCVYSPPQRVLEVPHRDQKDPNDPPKTTKGLNIANFVIFLTNLRYSDFTGFNRIRPPEGENYPKIAIFSRFFDKY